MSERTTDYVLLVSEKQSEVMTVNLSAVLLCTSPFTGRRETHARLAVDLRTTFKLFGLTSQSAVRGPGLSDTSNSNCLSAREPSFTCFATPLHISVRPQSSYLPTQWDQHP
jgi:hypothetical protein